jgi:hypothetical protein
MIMMCPVLSKIITDLNNQTYLFQEVCHGNSCQWWIEDIDDVNNSNCTFTVIGKTVIEVHKKNG